MDPMLNIPKNHKPRNPLRIIVLMGIAALMFLIAANQLDQVAQAIIVAQ